MTLNTKVIGILSFVVMCFLTAQATNSSLVTTEAPSSSASAASTTSSTMIMNSNTPTSSAASTPSSSPATSATSSAASTPSSSAATSATSSAAASATATATVAPSPSSTATSASSSVAPSASANSTVGTTSAVATTASSAQSTTATPTTEPEITATMVKIRVEIRITRFLSILILYEEVKDEKSAEGKKFRKDFKNSCMKRMKNRKSKSKSKRRARIWKMLIRRIRKGSVIVEYDLFVNATSQQEAQEFINELQQEINSGTIGNYTVDPDHPLGAKLTMQVPAGTPVPTKETSPSTMYIIMIVGLVIVSLIVILLIVLIVLICKRRSKVHSVKSTLAS